MRNFSHSPSIESALFPLTPIPSLRAQRLDQKTHTFDIYCFGATHLRDHLKPLGATAYKVGVTGCREVERRVEDCRRKRYAALLKRPGDPSDTGRELANGREWFLVPLQEAWLAGSLLPEGIAIRDATLRLTLPTGVTVQAVDRGLRALLEPRSLTAYLDSDEGQARLITAGYDPAARLHTRYTLIGRQPRLSLATELYLIRPRQELAAFVASIAAMTAALRREALIAAGA